MTVAVAEVEILRRSRENQLGRIRVYKLFGLESKLHVVVKGGKEPDPMLNLQVISEAEETDFLAGKRPDGTSAEEEGMEYVSEAGPGFPAGWKRKLLAVA